jgi:hypothetical protein
MYPDDFQYLDNGQFERLTGTNDIRNNVHSLDELKKLFESSSKSFRENSAKYYLY